MTPETRILVQYRLERARGALAEAVLLLDSGHGNTGVNRDAHVVTELQQGQAPLYEAGVISRGCLRRGGRHLDTLVEHGGNLSTVVRAVSHV
jgi:hypothetical protein